MAPRADEELEEAADGLLAAAQPTALLHAAELSHAAQHGAGQLLVMPPRHRLRQLPGSFQYYEEADEAASV